MVWSVLGDSLVMALDPLAVLSNGFIYVMALDSLVFPVYSIVTHEGPLSTALVC